MRVSDRQGTPKLCARLSYTCRQRQHGSQRHFITSVGTVSYANQLSPAHASAPRSSIAFLCGLVFASGFDLTRFGFAQDRVDDGAKPPPAQVAVAGRDRERVRGDRRPRDAGRRLDPDRARRSQRAQRSRAARQRRRRASRTSSASSTAAPQQREPRGGERLRLHRLEGRLHPHEQPRRRRRRPGDRHAVRQARRSRRRSIGRDPTTDVAVIKIDGDQPSRPRRSATTTSARVGQWVRRDRQSARPRLHRHGRHRQREGPHAAGAARQRAATRSPTTSRPTRRSTRATPAVRSSTSAAR